MPYITEERRVELDPLVERLADDLDSMGNVGGDLNYVITRLMARRVESVGISYEGLSSTWKEAVKAADEFHDRLIRPLEAWKCYKNGDVYGDLPERIVDLHLQTIADRLAEACPEDSVESGVSSQT